MCKKLFVTTLAILVALAVVKRTWVGSHVRCWWSRTCERVRGSVDPETEIARLEFEVKNLSGQEDVYIDRIARQQVEVNDRAPALKKKKEDLAVLHDRITTLRTALAQAGDSQSVSYHSKPYTKPEAEKQINTDFDKYELLEKDVASEDRYLTVLQKGLQQNEERLSALRRFRLDALTQLRDLRNERMQLQQAKKVDSVPVAQDEKSRRIQQDILRLKQQFKVEKEKLKLRGNDRGPIEEAEEAQARKEARQRKMDAKFPIRDVASK